ncbi:phosphate ABC transporter permease subunit PstC [Cellulomonas fengjieae]|uniref:Phosphate transport system permease protein n=1 Tax=Cellulomonas fengjieae TaxID=2819978 RepID=A0ABS3SHQ3_9CELL|nr:phosphate ABC transporter permease subunit PstC [Cellulomonas fengjieae]MBO3085019.1 phosphate ABC transporter permease subunit PstC [Cellulomonas fengjieae]MBO3100766.1 phosphate ABC transporter permease subunit PstC [Cellulomonas fengjieae]QVI66384.1 phosphate ABC transporter permease subunit PstC [Cellulomonas fengjieae]
MTSTQSPPTPSTALEPPAVRRRTRVVDRGASKAFRWTATGAGALILLVLVAVAAFLVLRAWPALTTPAAELTEKVSWMGDATSLVAFVGPLIFGTILAAALALVIATPVALGIALFISHYAPRRLAAGLGYLVDLLAAIPSVVYGLWGALVLAPMVKPVWAWLNEYLGFIPFFAGTASPTARVLLTVGIVLAVMILPIITAVSREVFLQTPRLHEEAALALGATRWEMVRTAVLPFARSGIVSAAMLGLGRALGETMAVLMILSPGFLYSFELLAAGQQQTIAANIAAQFPEANPLGVSALIATGLALFVITLLVNMAARAIVARRKDFSGAN